MIDDYKFQFTHFRMILRPYFDLIDYKQIILPVEEWTRFVNLIKSSIIRNPEQFLGNELPSENVLKQLIGDIFDEYLMENVATSSAEPA